MAFAWEMAQTAHRNERSQRVDGFRTQPIKFLHSLEGRPLTISSRSSSNLDSRSVGSLSPKRHSGSDEEHEERPQHYTLNH
jgi:hypothetical protein